MLYIVFFQSLGIGHEGELPFCGCDTPDQVESPGEDWRYRVGSSPGALENSQHRGVSGAQSWQWGRPGRRVPCSAGLGWQPAHTRHGKKETFTALKVASSVSSAWEGNENCWIDTAEKEGRELHFFFFLGCPTREA